VATKVNDGRGLASRNINAKHGHVIIIGITEIEVNNKRHLILSLSMQSQCLNCWMVQYNTCYKVYKDNVIGTGALFGCRWAPTTGGGTQIIGGGAGLLRAPIQFNPCEYDYADAQILPVTVRTDRPSWSCHSSIGIWHHRMMLSTDRWKLWIAINAQVLLYSSLSFITVRIKTGCEFCIYCCQPSRSQELTLWLSYNIHLYSPQVAIKRKQW